jgi:hypothetical protein
MTGLRFEARSADFGTGASKEGEERRVCRSHSQCELSHPGLHLEVVPRRQEACPQEWREGELGDRKVPSADSESLWSKKGTCKDPDILKSGFPPAYSHSFPFANLKSLHTPTPPSLSEKAGVRMLGEKGQSPAMCSLTNGHCRWLPVVDPVLFSGQTFVYHLAVIAPA